MASVGAPVLVGAVIVMCACGGSGTPEGSIVLTSDRDGDPELFVLGPDGEARQLTDNDGDDTNPDWSPDGSRIAFTSDRDGDLEIFVMNADGTGTRQLTHNEVDNGAADWSPDGTHIVYDGV